MKEKNNRMGCAHTIFFIVSGKLCCNLQCCDFNQFPIVMNIYLFQLTSRFIHFAAAVDATASMRAAFLVTILFGIYRWQRTK